MEEETTLDEWSVQIPDAAGKWEKVLVPFMRTIVEAGIPEIKWRATTINLTPSEMIMGVLTTGKRLEAHEVIEITMTTLPGYAVLVGAEDYGKHLVVSWKMVFNKYNMSFFRELVHDQGWKDAKNLTPSEQEDYTALKMITQDTIKEMAQNFGNEIYEDFSQEDEKSRGIINMDVPAEEVEEVESQWDDPRNKHYSSIWWLIEEMADKVDEDEKADKLLLGRTLDATKTAKGIRLQDRDAHFHVIGGSGSGKSRFLQSLIAQDIKNGVGFGVIDPHGDLVRQVKTGIIMFRRRFPGRENGLVLIDPTDKEYSVCLNPLEPIEGRDASDIAAELIFAFEKIWGDSWGARMQQIFRNALTALIENNLTLREVPLILNDAAVRRRLLRNVKDELCLEFFEKYERWSEREKLQYTESTLNKLDDFLANQNVRDMFLSPKSSFNLRQVMDEGKTLLVNLDRGQLKGASDLLGSLILSKIQMATFSRSDSDDDKRKPYYLYIDEFQDFASDNFVKVLSQSRKYGLYCTLAHQNLAQLSTALRAAILSNCDLMACFSVSRSDAEVMAKDLYGGVYDEPQAWEPRIQRLQSFNKREFIFKGNRGGISILKAFDVPMAWQPYLKTRAEYDEEFGNFETDFGKNLLRKRSDIRAEYQTRREALGARDEPESFREKKG